MASYMIILNGPPGAKGPLSMVAGLPAVSLEKTEYSVILFSLEYETHLNSASQ